MNTSQSVIRIAATLLFGSTLLTGCGDAASKAAVQACKQEMLNKIKGKMGELNEADMLANAEKLEDGNIQVESTVTFRRGTDQEVSQGFGCIVSADESGNYNRVVRMTVNW